MCSRACGARLRRKQAKARRDADLDGYRKAEVVRQRDSRRRRREAVTRAPEEVARPPSTGEVSRAEIAAQAHAIMSNIAANVNKAAALSRAEFRRQVSRIVKEGARELGKACA
jgi:hypothetical protein